jgi:hypothetical protein
MDGFVNVIKSDLITAEYDVYWNEDISLLQNAVPRPVLVVVSAWERGETDASQLTKMLEACKLKPEQYNVLQLTEVDKVSWRQLRVRYQPAVVFLIGVLPASLGVPVLFRLNEPNNFNETIWLPTISISELDKYAEVKRQLWINGMKPVFIDKKYGGL